MVYIDKLASIVLVYGNPNLYQAKSSRLTDHLTIQISFSAIIIFAKLFNMSPVGTE